MKRSKGMIIGFLAPAVLSYLIVFLYPTVRTILMSFFRVKEVSDPISSWSFNGLENYKKLLSTDVFQTAMKNIAVIWGFGLVAVMGSSMLLGIILTSGVRGKKFFRAVIYLPDIIASVAIGTMWVEYIYNAEYGLFNRILAFFRLDPVGWTGPDVIFWSMTIAFCFGCVGKYMLIYINGIERISPAYYEAATIEGAGIFRKFWSITVPLLRGIYHTNLTIWTCGVVGFFVWSQVFSPLSMSTGTVTPMIYMYYLVFGSEGQVSVHDSGAGAAIGVLLTLMILLVFACSNLLVKKDDIEF